MNNCPHCGAHIETVEHKILVVGNDDKLHVNRLIELLDDQKPIPNYMLHVMHDFEEPKLILKEKPYWQQNHSKKRKNRVYT